MLLKPLRKNVYWIMFKNGLIQESEEDFFKIIDLENRDKLIFFSSNNTPKDFFIPISANNSIIDVGLSEEFDFMNKDAQSRLNDKEKLSFNFNLSSNDDMSDSVSLLSFKRIFEDWDKIQKG